MKAPPPSCLNELLLPIVESVSQIHQVCYGHLSTNTCEGAMNQGHAYNGPGKPSG